MAPPGAGKTSIINLLARYDHDSGDIFIDGYNIQITRKSLRSSLGIVLQDTYLFSESVKDNIRYGRLDTNEEVKAAARLANAEQFILKTCLRDMTLFSPKMGGDLSRGQRQLLAIATSKVADPAILILDENHEKTEMNTLAL